MSLDHRGSDFVTLDGGEGGTGASPPIFADAIAPPFRMGFSRVYGAFAGAGPTDDVTFVGAAKLGLPDNAVIAIFRDDDGAQALRAVYGYEDGWGSLGPPELAAEITEPMSPGGMQAETRSIEEREGRSTSRAAGTPATEFGAHQPANVAVGAGDRCSSTVRHIRRFAYALRPFTPHFWYTNLRMSRWGLASVVGAPCATFAGSPTRGPTQRTWVPYISPSGSAISSMRAPSGSRK